MFEAYSLPMWIKESIQISKSRDNEQLRRDKTQRR